MPLSGSIFADSRKTLPWRFLRGTRVERRFRTPYKTSFVAAEIGACIGRAAIRWAMPNVPEADQAAVVCRQPVNLSVAHPERPDHCRKRDTRENVPREICQPCTALSQKRCWPGHRSICLFGFFMKAGTQGLHPNRTVISRCPAFSRSVDRSCLGSISRRVRRSGATPFLETVSFSAPVY